MSERAPVLAHATYFVPVAGIDGEREVIPLLAEDEPILVNGEG
jgi:hypothetical protein